jgi:hypothetical protein
MVHLKVHTEQQTAQSGLRREAGGFDEMQNSIQYNPNIPEPIPVEATSKMNYQEYSDYDEKEKLQQPFIPGITNTLQRNEVLECNKDYKDTKQYPRIAKAVCWWDGHAFTGKPCFIPKAIRGYSRCDITYDVYGNFCSPECALAFLENERNIDPEVRWDRVVMLNEMTRRVLNENIDNIEPALPRWSLTEYGGPLTLEKFREINTKPSIKCEVIYPPITAEIPQIQLSNTDFVAKRPKRVVIDEERFTKAEENLRKISAYNMDKPKQDLKKGGILDMMNIRIPEISVQPYITA